MYMYQKPSRLNCTSNWIGVNKKKEIMEKKEEEILTKFVKLDKVFEFQGFALLLLLLLLLLLFKKTTW
jgi:hypothetical protein